MFFFFSARETTYVAILTGSCGAATFSRMDHDAWAGPIDSALPDDRVHLVFSYERTTSLCTSLNSHKQHDSVE
jgi:hypothetical protein